MKKLLLFVLSLTLFGEALFAQSPEKILSDVAEDLKGTTFPNDPSNSIFYKLENGLTVIISQDKSATTAFGGIVVKAGGKTDPAEATGMAHYLEHMLFKGTKALGTIDYEKEKVHLDRITDLYKELKKTSLPEERLKIQKQINEESKKAGEYAIPNELDRLLASIGGKGVNAFTSMDMTVYHNLFPTSQISAWLDIYAHRFQDPVFRLFQSELETVYEEKNRANDQFVTKLLETFNENFYKTHPYGQQTVIGTTEHLKNPPLHTMYKYFYEYYVPNNMALVISGNVKPNEVIELVKEKFGGWKPAKVKASPVFNEKPFSGREFVEVKLSPVKVGVLGFRSPAEGHQDIVGLEVVQNLLSNSEESGLLDKEVSEGNVMAAEVIRYPNLDGGASIIFFVPKIIGQKLETAEEIVFSALQKVKDGDFSDKDLEAVKLNLIKEYKRNWESTMEKGLLLATSFVSDVPWSYYINYPEQVKRLTKADVQQIASQYFGKDFLCLHSKMGFPKKEKITKPPFDPVIPKNEVKSAYAKHFTTIKPAKEDLDFVDFKKDLDLFVMSDKIKFYRVENPYNDIFSIKIEYGIGTYHDPRLKYFEGVSSYLGTTDMTDIAFKKALYALGGSFYITSQDDRFTLNIEGIESNYQETMNLVKTYLTEVQPNDEKINRLLDDLKTERKIERKTPSSVSRALNEYVLYGNESTYLKEFSKKEEKKLKTSELIGAFREALTYEVKIHFVGNLEPDIIERGLSRVLNREKITKPAKPLLVRHRSISSEQTIFFLEDKKATQSQVYFLMDGKKYVVEETPMINGFNQYFGGDMSSLVFQEIREFRSLAYSAYGRYITPPLKGKHSLFLGFIGCQADKTIDAIEAMDNLIRKMPEKPERHQSIQVALMEKTKSSRPSFRRLSSKVEKWKQLGYESDPNEMMMKQYSSLRYKYITDFYKSEIQSKPYTITIVGNPKKIDFDKLKQFGKVVKVKKKRIYNN